MVHMVHSWLCLPVGVCYQSGTHWQAQALTSYDLPHMCCKCIDFGRDSIAVRPIALDMGLLLTAAAAAPAMLAGQQPPIKTWRITSSAAKARPHPADLPQWAVRRLALAPAPALHDPGYDTHRPGRKRYDREDRTDRHRLCPSVHLASARACADLVAPMCMFGASHCSMDGSGPRQTA